MAMVFKSKKDLIEPLQKDKEKPGPGDYLPQTEDKKIHINKEPFLSTINGTFRQRNNYPGPGSYYQDDILIKYLKNIQNEKITDNNDKREINKNIYETRNRDKLGFNSKTKRFNIFIDSNNPGPGYYFPKINKYYKNKLNKIKEEEYNSKQRQFMKITKEFKLIPTIPSKNQKFGFDILEDGKIIQKKDPNLYQTFSGEKGDTVGPGTYEVVKKNDLYKTRPIWTMSKDVRNCYITNWENLSKIEPPPSLISTNHSDHSSNFNNSNLLSSITANKFFVDDNLNVKELSPYNISNYSISNYDSQTNFNNNSFMNFANFTHKKLNTNNKPITNNLYYNEKYKKIPSRQIYNIKNTPGPGFYIDRFKHSSFRFKSVPENKQFFGSRLERFYNINKSYDYYNYIDDSYADENKTKSNSFNSLAPFTCKDQRFKTPYYLREKFENPSPFDYNNNKMKKTKSFSNFEKFNTSQKRFIEEKNVKWRNDLPGPGYYNPDKIRKHISTKKIINPINKKSNKDKSLNIYINPINYKINTIEYLNNRKTNSTNLKNVTFFRCNPKINKSSSCGNIGPSPGAYYKEKKYEYKQIMPPFNSSSEKKVEIKRKSDINVGSGQYNHDSYFDWHKKSFNISYV